MTIEEMKKKKSERGYTYEQIARLADLPVGTVQKVLGGITKSPRYATLQALQRVFESEPERDAFRYLFDKDDSDFSEQDCVREPSFAYGLDSRSYTVEDYLALPEDRRVELIDGVFYDMAAPTHIHQMLSTEIWRCFSEYIRKNHGDCRPLVAPLDVQLDCDDRTMVQPDVMILCDPDKIRHGRLYGAPDLVVEIASRSSSVKDGHLKRSKYERAGVREYWIVYPEQKKVVVYCFEKDDIPKIYGFTDAVPVGIYNGACVVDFAEINDYIGIWYERL
ncbi:MAG: Uma2 family endonuclease [Lachnospiraceae bacterium]|nr:Uma2 family endonuclease [Lachnospiraceae bacterium]